MINIRYLWLTGCLLSISINVLFAQVPSNKPSNETGPPSATQPIKPVPAAYSSAIRINYVRTREALKPVATESSLEAFNYLDAVESASYFDGLGRPIQTVNRQVTPGAKDMIAPVIYDSLGRETYKYLPYVQVGSGGSNDGKFKLNPFADQAAFYQNNSINPGTTGEQVFYGVTKFETSPLNRVEKVLSPGNSWAGSDKGVKSEYLVSSISDSVRIWNITNTGLTYLNNDVATNIPTTSALYEPAQLYKNVVKDENGNVSVEYVDKSGKILLKKVQIGDIAADYSGYSGFLCTYYIYDDFGQLRFVMQPKAVAILRFNNWQFQATVIDELCFRYEYDEKGRVIAKKVPGSGWVFSVYDKRDRLVYSQDANMRDGNKWLTNLYDGLNRPVATGLITYIGNRDQLQLFVNSLTGTPSEIEVPMPAGQNDLYVNNRVTGVESYVAGSSVAFTDGFVSEQSAEFVSEITTQVNYEYPIQVDDDPLPTGANFVPLSFIYYDDYSWTNKAFTDAYNPQFYPNPGQHPIGLPTSLNWTQASTIGMVTGVAVRVIEDPDNLQSGRFLFTANFYDSKGRMVQTNADNYKGGVDINTTQFSFNGLVLGSFLQHSNPASDFGEFGIKTDMLYDHRGRLLQVDKRINQEQILSEQSYTIAKYEYDEHGRIKNKHLGLKDRPNLGSDPLETLNNTYSIRGWLKGINIDYANGIASAASRWFGMELNYDWGNNANQINGNIAGIKWRSRGDGERRAYGFGYDKLNRLLYGDFSQFAGSSYIDNSTINFDMMMGNGTNPSTAFDENGNIIAMKQYGLKVNASALIDDLNYRYIANSNKLLNVFDNQNDALTKLGDFRTSTLHPEQSKTATTIDYAYDKNGNLTKDLNKDIGSSSSEGIKYNHLNLPYQITVRNSTGTKGTITYIYDAAGNKLEKRVQENGITLAPSKVTTYMGSMVYENDTMQFISHEEGRMRLNKKRSVVGIFPCDPREGHPEDCDFDRNVYATRIIPAYDYFIKDHLGNIRMVLTEDKDTAHYVATMETQFRPKEEQLFYKVPETQFPAANVPGGYPSDTSVTNPNLLVSKLNGSDQKIGPSIILKVTSGDKVDVGVKSFYRPQGSPGPVSNSLQDIVSVLASGIVGVTGESKGTYTQLIDPGTGPLVGAMNSFRNTNNPDISNKPKAYLNWILLDEQFKYVNSYPQSGAIPVGNADVINTLAYSGIEVTKTGYLYIYVGNETQNWDVFFDNLSVKHYSGPLVEETHYYPFGLTMAGISSKALKPNYAENKKKYNGIEKEDALGIEIYDAQLRELDPQIGRWWQIDPKIESMEMWSPYTSNYDNPVRYSDPLGDEGEDCCFDFVIKTGMKLVENHMRAQNRLGEWTSETVEQAGVNFERRWAARADPIHRAIDNPLSIITGPLGMEANAARTVVTTESSIARTATMESTVARTTAAESSVAKTAVSEATTAATSETKAAASQVPTVKEQATSLSKQVGKNTITIKTPKGAIHYDLQGTTHKGVPTPHVQRSLYNTNPKTGQTFLNKDNQWVRPLTQQDIRTVMKFIEKYKKS